MSVLRPPAALAAALALTAVALQVGLEIGPLGVPRAVHAEDPDGFGDADKDLVPDCLELLGQTDPTKADTDGDGVDDFEEILTFTNTSHQTELTAKPVDHAIRVAMTSTPRAGGGSDAYLHLMMRFVNLPMSQVRIHDIYANQNGREVSLMGALGYGEVRVERRERERDGVSYLISMRIGSLEDLQRFAPCTIGVRAVLGGKRINAGTLLMPTGTDAAVLLPYRGSLILQPINTAVYFQDANPYYRGGGRVCEMGLSTIGRSRNGTLCEVDWAKCKAAAGLNCSSSCSSKAGTTVVIPDGLGTITGGR